MLVFTQPIIQQFEYFLTFPPDDAGALAVVAVVLEDAAAAALHAARPQHHRPTRGLEEQNKYIDGPRGGS